MDIETPVLSPKQRLENTRRAIAGQLAQKRGGTIHTEEEEFFATPAALDSGMFASARRAARAWWRAHPVHHAVDLAQPLLGEYARHNPYQLLGIAAGTGAALTLLKSFRLLSLTGVAVALAKTSDFRSTARYFMNSRGAAPATAPMPPEV